MGTNSKSLKLSLTKTYSSFNHKSSYLVTSEYYLEAMNLILNYVCSYESEEVNCKPLYEVKKEY